MNTDPISLPDDVVLSVRGVSKKFCRNLRRSMWYGIQDLSRNLLGLHPKGEVTSNELRVTSDESAPLVTRHSSLVTSLLSPVTHPPSLPSPSLITGHSSLPRLRRDEFWAVEDVSFDLKRGECVGLIGRNGCGKSTLLRLIAGIFPPDAGEIAVRGRLGALIALGVGFHPHMTGRENVYLNGTILGLSQSAIRENFRAIVEFSEIGEFIDAPVSTYSSGMCVRLGFSIATATRPDVLLIDEVLAVGDLGFRVKCIRAIDELVKSCAVVFVSHSMEFVQRICSKVIVLERGRIGFFGQGAAPGIQYYHSLMSAKVRQVVATEGNARIADFRVLVERKVGEMFEVRPSEPLELDFDVVNPPDEGWVVMVTLTNTAGESLSEYIAKGVSVLAGAPSSQLHCRVEIPATHLTAGIYHMNVALLSFNFTRVYYSEHGVASLQITGSRVSYASFAREVEIKHEIV